jgi:anthranilate phosphoribosyltransferase
MFQGLEGYDDVRPGSTAVAVWNEPGSGRATDPERHGELVDFEIETPAYGMEFAAADLHVEDVAADSAAITRGVLTGDRTDRFADAVAVTAALRIYAAGDVPEIRTGLERARAAIEDGTAAAKLAALRAF